jgi:hypothetical protein
MLTHHAFPLTDQSLLGPISSPRKKIESSPSLELVLECVLCCQAARNALDAGDGRGRGAVRLSSSRMRALYDEAVSWANLDSDEIEIACPRPFTAAEAARYEDGGGDDEPAPVWPQKFCWPRLQCLTILLESVSVESVRQLALAATGWPLLRELEILDFSFPEDGLADLFVCAAA